MNSNIPEYVNKNDPAFLYLNLHPEEDIKLIIRRHWGGFLGTLGIGLAMIVFPFILLILVYVAGLEALVRYKDAIIIACSGYLIFLQTFLFATWVNFYYDIIIVTSERMININQEGLLARKVSELSLREIQNVTAQQEGILQSFLDFGRLVVETAGEGTTGHGTRPGLEGYFTIDDVPQTNHVARTILELSRKVHDEDRAAE